MAQKDQIIYMTMKTIKERTGWVLLNNPFNSLNIQNDVTTGHMASLMVETPLTSVTAIAFSNLCLLYLWGTPITPLYMYLPCDTVHLTSFYADF